MSTLRLTGAIPANIMPFASDGSIDEHAYRRHVDWLLTQGGAAAVTSNGHAAEVTSLSRDERRRAIQLSAEVIAGRVPLIAGVPGDTSEQAIAFASDALTEGANALLVFPLNILALGGSSALAVRHVQAIEQAVAAPLVLFLYPQWTGMHYELDTLVEICQQVPSVIAVKEWTLDIRVYERNVAALRSLDRHVSVLSSFSTNLLPSLVVGADGILSGHGSVIVNLHRLLLDAVNAGDLVLAQSIYNRIQILTRVVYRPPLADMYARMKEQLVMLDRLPQAVSRPPLMQPTTSERADLRESLRLAGLLLDRSKP